MPKNYYVEFKNHTEGIDECQNCGALVINQNNHLRWHWRINVLEINVLEQHAEQIETE